MRNFIKPHYLFFTGFLMVAAAFAAQRVVVAEMITDET